MAKPDQPETSAPTLLWLRQDLRVSDNPALVAASRGGGIVVPVYLLDEDLGGASRWWLHHSLARLAARFADLGSPLILQRGDPAKVIPRLARTVGAGRVVWSHCVEPKARKAADDVASALDRDGIATTVLHGNTLFRPGTIRTGSGGQFKVFTAFWRKCLTEPQPAEPLPAPRALRAPDTVPGSESLDSWNLLPRRPDWAGGLRATWAPGEDGARKRLANFLENALPRYDGGRDVPGDDAGTSGLSPHLHFGEISPRAVWHAARRQDVADRHVDRLLSELGWRDFAHHLMEADPRLATHSQDRAFDRIEWNDDAAALHAWQRGRTGYPIVDAGMRQLWATGFMHNRVRMIVASFLVKDLLVRWQAGADWFMDTLVDADLPANAMNWQWVAGCGVDAAPFFRIFNPTTQGQKFDGDGRYVRRWVPELAALPDRHLHAPHAAPRAILDQAGIVLGRDYPLPIVDHAAARLRALESLRRARPAED
ncbi:cryptochrome/photolyase family protein [Zavarzinia sp. CC-PAN008]|uniref:cryptochrome/photolyase family protein n=1 Tax=Zavarzinia sp. CC-PAN008 TaxID=3243332 RepID=UPI003F745377